MIERVDWIVYRTVNKGKSKPFLYSNSPEIIAKAMVDMLNAGRKTSANFGNSQVIYHLERENKSNE